jgi:hypothetical protein
VYVYASLMEGRDEKVHVCMRGEGGWRSEGRVCV